MAAMNTFGLHRRAVLVKTLLNHHAIATVSGKAIRTPLGMVRDTTKYTTSNTSATSAPTLSHTRLPTASASENSNVTELQLIEICLPLITRSRLLFLAVVSVGMSLYTGWPGAVFASPALQVLGT